jgi:hypothetical protein
MKGFVYLIINDNICKGYVGSTIDMEIRMKKHKSKKNNCASKEIMCNPYTHEILEEVEFEELEELTIVEQKWINLYKPYLVNKKNAYITAAERKEYGKAKAKARYAANREVIRAQQKAKYAANLEVMRAQQKAYRDANREAVSTRNKAKYAAKKISKAKV